MPQMAPIMWLNIFFIMLLSIMLLLNLVYFLSSKKQFKILLESVKMKNTSPKAWLW